MYSFSYLEPVCCSISSSNCCFLTCIYVSLVFPILLLSSISLHWSLRKAFLSLIAIFWNYAFKWVYLSFSPLPFTSPLFIAVCKLSSYCMCDVCLTLYSDKSFASLCPCHDFSLEMFLRDKDWLFTLFLLLLPTGGWLWIPQLESTYLLLQEMHIVGWLIVKVQPGAQSISYLRRTLRGPRGYNSFHFLFVEKALVS